MNISAVRQALATALRLRAAWASAEVFEYPAGVSAKKAQRLELTTVNATNEDLGYRGDDDATIVLNGLITCLSAGATEVQWRTAEDAAIDLLFDLREYLRTREAAFGTSTVAGTANAVKLTTWNGAASQDDQGTVFYRLDFALEVRILN